jgi:hypothetical protein
MVVFLFLMLMILAIVREQDFGAGVMLAASTIKPQMVLVIVPWVLWWAVWRNRYKIPLGFLAAMLALAGSTALLHPDWPVSFFGQLSHYTSYTEFGSAIWILTTYYLRTPPAVELVLTAAVGAGLVYAAWHWRRAEVGKMLWISSLMLVGTHFIAPRTATTHFAPYLLPLFLLFEHWRQTHSMVGERLAAISLFLILVGTWTLFILTVDGIQESALNYLPIPALLVFGLFAVRRRLISAWSRP